MKQKRKEQWDDDRIKDRLLDIIDEIGHFPTTHELDDLGKSYLRGAISFRGGINKYRVILGYKPKRRENGIWTEESVIGELEKIQFNLGHFPKIQELNSLNYGGLPY